MCAPAFHRDRARHWDSRVNSAPKGPNHALPGAISRSIAIYRDLSLSRRALDVVPVCDETDRPPLGYS